MQQRWPGSDQQRNPEPEPQIHTSVESTPPPTTKTGTMAPPAALQTSSFHLKKRIHKPYNKINLNVTMNLQVFICVPYPPVSLAGRTFRCPTGRRVPRRWGAAWWARSRCPPERCCTGRSPTCPHHTQRETDALKGTIVTEPQRCLKYIFFTLFV